MKNPIIVKYNSSFVIILVIFVIKLITVLYLVFLTNCANPESVLGIASYSGDASSYIAPVDNFINEGHYYYYSAKAGRMPYVGLVYYPFRLLFSKQIALSIVVLLQTLIESIAIFYLALLCEKFVKNRKAFWFFIVLSCISLNVTFFDYYILSESFGISFLCICTYHYYQFLAQNRKSTDLIYTGIFLGLAVLFRPYLCLLFLILGVEFIYYEYYHKNKDFVKTILRNTLLVSCALIILSAPWIIRNYIVLNKFVPFQQDPYAGYNYSKADFAYRNFVTTIGESFIYWDKNSAGCYFEFHNLPCEYQFPSRIFSKELTMDKIEETKSVYLKYQKNRSDSLEKLTIEKFNNLTKIYKKENKLFYYFATPFILCKKFLIHSGSYYLPINKKSVCYHPYQWILKISQSLMYYLCLIFGFVGLVVLFRKDKKTYFILSIPLFLILLFPIILKGTEFRFFHMAYPFLLIGLCYIIGVFNDLLFLSYQKKNEILFFD